PPSGWGRGPKADGRRRVGVGGRSQIETEDAVSADPMRLSMSVGEAMFTQRAIRRFKPDPIPADDLRLVLEAASKAPNGGNRQVARFLVITDRKTIQAFGALYHEAWWAKRLDEKGWTRLEDIPPEEKNYR